VASVTYEKKTIELADDQSVLEGLLDAGFDIPFACKAGACHSCLMVAKEGVPPNDAQKGLKQTQQVQNFFLACSCKPESDLTISLPSDDAVRIHCSVTSKSNLSTDVIELRLRPEKPLEYRAGQYLTLWKDHHDGRSYSLASVPELDEDLILQIRDFPNGVLSEWVHNQLQLGGKVDVQGAYGDCFYVPEDLAQPLLLVGTSTGLAPLYGVLRDALNQGHHGEIHLCHGALDLSGLYLVDELSQLAADNENFFYHPSVVKGDDVLAENIEVGPVDELAMTIAEDFKAFRIFLCGAPDLVASLKKKAFMQGANMKNIYADPFLPPAKKD
jgi:NAD(P)H-flavin reductase/ferredoxin